MHSRLPPFLLMLLLLLLLLLGYRTRRLVCVPSFAAREQGKHKLMKRNAGVCPTGPVAPQMFLKRGLHMIMSPFTLRLGPAQSIAKNNNWWWQHSTHVCLLRAHACSSSWFDEIACSVVRKGSFLSETAGTRGYNRRQPLRCLFSLGC